MSATTFLGLPAVSNINLSLYALPVAYFLAFFPHELKLSRLGTRYSNNKPRDPVAFRKGDTEEYKQAIEKLGGIHHNGMEQWPLFAVSVILINYAHLPVPYINSFAIFYVVQRIAYDLIYYFQIGFISDSLRTGVFLSGMLSCLWMIVQAAVKVG